ncbi:hypothetical protein M011DRAFT_459767 [Sporormia fimetaria CBS 119925]|uniref:tRNA-splicing endonuclease-like protein n=1 Tax=Sporormia fimetaria CBS 119925 TaxID=1340428 RepID=A0A6A6V9N5_9PLEO|nr:hypothetical protein M011DRAFT_459767 [Sporormia fimetaria CBS 119925]
MTHIIDRIHELQALPSDLHLFCPRSGDESDAYYEEDLAGVSPEDRPADLEEKIQQAQERKLCTLDALQVMAFDGEEAEQYQAWLTDRLQTLMTSCDVCVRVFHQSRSEWKERLLQQYEDEDNVSDFLRLIDDMCIKRITAGLDEAHSILSAAEPKQRTVRILPSEAMYAMFEALSCEALLRREDLLRRHFDGPFELVQSKKKLKLPTILPAMTRFLFSDNERRRDWAISSWSTFKRTVLRSEFDWAVRGYILDAMERVHITYLDLEFTPHFWFGMRLILSKADKEIVTHSIRSLEGNIYEYAMQHLSLKSEGFLDLINTINLLLEISPADFWDALGKLSPNSAVAADQILRAPMLSQILVGAGQGSQKELEHLDLAFTWIQPLISSIKAANLTSPCKVISQALLSTFQSPKYPEVSRKRCRQEGLRVLDYCFKKMNEGKSLSTFVGQPTVNGMLEIISTYISTIVDSLKHSDGEENTLALSMIQQAFILESQSLAVERQLITAKQPSPTETPPSRPIWKAVLAVIDPRRLDLAVFLLIAGRNLIGLEPLLMKKNATSIPPTVRHFNDRFTLLSQSITDVMDRLSEFDPRKLDALFEQPAAASGIISTLFSSTEETRNAAVELLQVISGKDERRDALQYILRTHYLYAIQGIADSCRQVMRKKAFSPAPSLVKTCSDIIDVLCNAQDGILRSRDLTPDEAKVTMTLWKSLWETLTMIFRTTEDWSNLGYHDKTLMMDFCRDTMQFADQLFDECSVFSGALNEGMSESDKDPAAGLREGSKVAKSTPLKELLLSPTSTMADIVGWLRLRDEFLSTRSVSLISKLLGRLHKVSIEVDIDTLTYIERVLNGQVKAKLPPQQEAELQKALETHLGHPLVKEEDQIKQAKQASLSQWMSSGSTTTYQKPEAQSRADVLAEATRTHTAFQARLKAQGAAKAKKDETKAAAHADFRKKRQAELERQKREKEAALAKIKKDKALSALTAEAGSGLEGLGVLGKEQAPKGEGLMHSSDESEDDQDDFDEELFGIKKESKVKAGPKTNIIDEIKIQMPVKKRRVVRSAKDMRARLAPDLSPLHKAILSWNYFHDGDFPPNARPEMYSAVPDTFRTPDDYQRTFEPLLTLEAWQGFVKNREENMLKPYEVRILTRAAVDMWQEVSSTLTHAENKELGISEGDVVLLSQSKTPSPKDPHCLARVSRVQRKPQHLEISYRVLPSGPLQRSLVPKGTVYGSKVQSITPLEREYAALLGLQYYDLCDEIILAKPSPLMTYKDSHLDPLIGNYNVNKAQAKAIKSAIDNDGFTLIQGPPGSGKTKTIVAIVGGILSPVLRSLQGRTNRSKKLLVCAPSNAAVDELVMRFKQGVTTLNGQHHKTKIVRLGRSDAINANVQDVTLEELVNKRLGVNNGNNNDAADSRKVFDEHKQVSEQVRMLQMQLDSGTLQGPEASRLQDDLNALRARKRTLGTNINNIKDNEKIASRNADITRKRVQEQVLGEADIICATLSGSGHDMFQGLSIEFETVIVDEAAQCVEMSALIPMKYGCAKCILVGDPKQLPPTVFSKQAAKFQYEQSLFVRMQNNHPEDVHLLDTQYRMHPEISSFPSQTFYDGKLLDGGNMAKLRKQPWHSSLLLGPYRFFDVQGQHQAAPKGHSLINIAEINVALQLYKRLTHDYNDITFKGKIGIITPYKSQLRELKQRFSQQYGNQILEDVEFNTTDAFQGRESEVIIFSCVRASPAGGIGFLQDIRRMNVGLTRAKSSLWVLGNSQSLVRGEFWKLLVEDARRRQRYTDGDVMGMLREHSSAFPAPKEMYVEDTEMMDVDEVPKMETVIKQEKVREEDWLPRAKMENDSAGFSDGRRTSLPIATGKRKAESDSDADDDDDLYNDKRQVKVKTEPNARDSEISTTRSATPATNTSGVSTPAEKRDVVGSGKPGVETAPTGLIGNGMGEIRKPKIRTARRPATNPLLAPVRPKPKKPRNG